MSWIKKNRKLLIASFLALALGLGTGYGLGSAIIPDEGQNQPGAEPVGQIGQTSVLPTTEVKVRYHFLLCGHELDQTEKNGPLTGATFNEITTRLPGAKILMMNSAHVEIERELEKYCPNHYLLYINGDSSLCVSQTDSRDYEMDNVQTLQFEVETLPQDVHDALGEGLVFETLEEINYYFEGLDG